MGDEKTTVVQGSSQTQQTRVKPTAEETEFNQLALERARGAQEGQLQTQQLGSSLINQLLAGKSLPGYLGGLPGGISPEMTADISQQAVQDVLPSFQNLGLMDSGAAFQGAANVAGDIRRGSAEFNMGNLLNLLNLAVGGQAQIQSPLIAQSAQLGNQLAGLRGINQSSVGSTSQTTTGMNPFMKSFQTSLGSTLGNLPGAYADMGKGFAGFSGNVTTI